MDIFYQFISSLVFFCDVNNNLSVYSSMRNGGCKIAFELGLLVHDMEIYSSLIVFSFSIRQVAFHCIACHR